MKRQNIHRQSGFSLIELLIALAINLVIVAAAAYLYLGTSESKRILSQQQQLSENGQYALDLIGRDITNAGFYPSVREIVGGLNARSYKSDSISLSQTAFNHGVFGCSGQSFSPSTKACVAHSDSAVTADTIVINFFTNDAMGPDIGQRRDCTRSNVAGATENSGRTVAGTNNDDLGPVPTQPLFVSNRYTLSTTAYNIEGQAITTQSLACNGNGNTANVYQPAIVGIESLQFLYGVYSDESLQPQRFYAASAVAGLGGTTDIKLPQAPWARVVAVEVCLVARGLEASKLTTSTGAVTPYVNCAGTSVTPTDRFIRKVYRKTFAMRNNLTLTIKPAL